MEIEGKKVGKSLYYINVVADQDPQPENVAALLVRSAETLTIWHQRFGHLNRDAIRKMISLGAVSGLTLIENPTASSTPCVGCILGKMHRQPFPSGRTRATEVGQLIHSDVCGPMQVPTPSGSRYFVIFKDDCSGWTAVRFLKHKSEVHGAFREFVILMKRDTGKEVKIFRSDNGGEFTGGDFEKWLSSSGIHHQCSAPHTPQQNGVAERANRTLMEAARSLMHEKGVPIELWGEAIGCATYVLNRSLSYANNKTPYEIWFGKKPNVANLRIFGSRVFSHIPDANRRKLDPKARESILAGYSEKAKAYRIWHPETRSITISRDVFFDEATPPNGSKGEEQTSYHIDLPLITSIDTEQVIPLKHHTKSYT